MLKNFTVIIGAGPCGIAAAKYAKQLGLDFILLEKSDDIGGIWNPKTGLVWKGMHTNNSKVNCRYSDFEWPFQPDIYPTNEQFFKYMKAYAQEFDIMDKIKFNCEVIELYRQGEQYVVMQKCKEQITQRKVKNVIIASGLFCDPYIPDDIKGLQNFKGQIIHSRNYKNSQQFAGKNILVVGGSFTSAQISADLANSAKTIYNIFRRPFFILPRFLDYDGQHQFPADLNSYIRKPDLSPTVLVPSENQILQKQSKMIKVCSKQQQYADLRISQQDINQPLSRAITTGYLESVQTKKIIPRKTIIKQFKQKSVLLQSGQEIDINTVIFCTGCKPSLKYLSPQIKQIIKIQPWNQKHPAILFKSILHHKLPNLYFLGILRGILVPICQMQARFAISMIAGRGRFPSEQQIKQGLQVETHYRNLPKIPQSRFPHPLYCDQLVPYLDLQNNLVQLRQSEPQLFKKFISLPLIQTKHIFTTRQIQWQIEQAQNAIKQCLIKK